MADIFISYSKAERSLTAALAEELEAHGYSVWWDTNLVSGDQYQKTIVAELEAARAVIVIWTPSSTQSEWVYSEANRAARRNKLIPIRLPVVDIYDIPPPFDVRQTDLVHNRKAIYAALARLGVTPPPQGEAPTRPGTAAADATPPAPAATSAAGRIDQPVAASGSQDAGRPERQQADAPSVSASPPVVTKDAATVPAAPTGAGRERQRRSRVVDASRAVHWQKTKRLAAGVLLLWTIIALAVHLGAAELNQVRFLGFPLGFYLAAQGSLLGFLALLGWFVRHQNSIDRAVTHSEFG